MNVRLYQTGGCSADTAIFRQIHRGTILDIHDIIIISDTEEWIRVELEGVIPDGCVLWRYTNGEAAMERIE